MSVPHSERYMYGKNKSFIQVKPFKIVEQILKEHVIKFSLGKHFSLS